MERPVWSVDEGVTPLERCHHAESFDPLLELPTFARLELLIHVGTSDFLQSQFKRVQARPKLVGNLKIASRDGFLLE